MYSIMIIYTYVRSPANICKTALLVHFIEYIDNILRFVLSEIDNFERTTTLLLQLKSKYSYLIIRNFLHNAILACLSRLLTNL